MSDFFATWIGAHVEWRAGRRRYVESHGKRIEVCTADELLAQIARNTQAAGEPAALVLNTNEIDPALAAGCEAVSKREVTT